MNWENLDVAYNWEQNQSTSTSELEKKIDDVNDKVDDMSKLIITEEIDTDTINLPNSTDGTININGVTDDTALTTEITRNDLLPTTACFKEFFDLVYPIGSMRIEYNELQGEHIVENGNAVLVWLFGSKWQPVSLNGRHIKGTAPAYPSPPTTWTLPNLKHYGGSETHTHTTGDCTLTEAQMPIHDHGLPSYHSFVEPYNEIYILSFHTEYGQYGYGIGSNVRGGGGPHNHGDTGSASNEYKSIELAFYVRIA